MVLEPNAPPPPGHFQNHENDNSSVYYALLGDYEASRPLPHSSKTKKGGVREGWMGGKYKLRGEGRGVGGSEGFLGLKRKMRIPFHFVKVF